MKLSMWTINAWLEARGLTLSQSITEGLPRISSFRRSEFCSFSPNLVEIVPPEKVAGKGKYAVALCSDMDYILVADSDPVTVGNYLAEAFEFYNGWESRMFSRMLEGASMQELLDIANTVFNRPMFIKNDSSWTFAITRGYPSDVHPAWAKMENNVGKRTADFEAVRTVSTDPEFRSVFTEKYPSISRSPSYGGMLLHANIFLSNRRVGEIIALENGVPFNKGEVHLMHVFAELIEKYIRNNTELFISVSDPATFLAALIEKRGVESENLPAIYRSAGLRPEDEICAAVIEDRSRSDTPILRVLREKLDSQLRGAVVFQYRSQIVCLMSLSAERGYDAAMKQLSALVPADAFVWGASYEFTGLNDLSDYYEQAQIALKKAREHGENWATVYQVACECISEKCLGIQGSRLLVHPDLVRLREADEKEKSQYSRTLFNFLLCGGNYTDTAAIMGLHRNSLIYRMNKIRSIMRTNPDDLENRELLLFSYMIMGSR